MEPQAVRTEKLKEEASPGGSEVGVKRKHEEEEDSPSKKLVIGNQPISDEQSPAVSADPAPSSGERPQREGGVSLQQPAGGRAGRSQPEPHLLHEELQQLAEERPDR